MYKYYDYLGFMTPYVCDTHNKIEVIPRFTEAISQNNTNEIDVPGVIQVLSHYHCFGDRTLIKRIKRSPWMAKPNADSTAWDYARIPPHQNRDLDLNGIVKTLQGHLEEELLDYLKNKKKVGVLLSGGMDSRVLSALLYNVIEKHGLTVNVTALTWGIKESRDVQYALRIADKLNWHWQHFELSPENLEQNIEETALHGCEFSPLHLHAMPKVRDYASEEKIDCVLAASFGDSIGRAEYSGKHVTRLKPVESYIRNWFRLVNPEVYKNNVKASINDAIGYRKFYPNETRTREMEIEKQSQYLRRQLNPCMAVINEKVPVFQLFTSPKVYKFMWSLNPKLRNNEIYELILKNAGSGLLEIPWARTGLTYMTNNGVADTYTKEHSYYGKWIREDLKHITKKAIFSGDLERLGIFNMDCVEQLYSINQKYYTNIRHSKVEEMILWLASLSKMANRFKLNNNNLNIRKNSSINLNKTLSKAELLVYKSLLPYKNIK